MRHLFKVSMALIFAGLFSTSHALDAPPSDGIRCLVVGALMVNSTDTNQRTAGTIVMLYWMGRLESFSAQEIEDAMFSESVAITPAEIETETARCGAVLQEKGQMMQQIVQNIIRRGKEMQKQNASPAKAPSDSKPTT